MERERDDISLLYSPRTPSHTPAAHKHAERKPPVIEQRHLARSAIGCFALFIILFFIGAMVDSFGG
jgi:hypothetical protein